MQNFKQSLTRIAFSFLVTIACGAPMFAQQCVNPQVDANYIQVAQATPLPTHFIQNSNCWNSVPCPPCSIVSQPQVVQQSMPLVYSNPMALAVAPVVSPTVALPMQWQPIGTPNVWVADSYPCGSCSNPVIGVPYAPATLAMNYPAPIYQGFPVQSVRPLACSGCKSKRTPEELERIKRTFTSNPNLTPQQRLENCWQYCDQEFPDYPCNGECHEHCPDFHVDECNCFEVQTDWGPQLLCELGFLEDEDPSNIRTSGAASNSVIEATEEVDSPEPVADEETRIEEN